MDRRAAAALVASMVLGGCGGGGGTPGTPGGGGVIAVADPSPAPAPSPTPAPAPPSTAPIAAWGDSLTPPFAANLQLLYPERLVYNGGVAGQSSTEISIRQRAGGRDTWVNIFWMGTNNPTQPAQIKADIAASVAALAPGNDRFLILAVLNKACPEELRGGDVYNTIVQLDRDLAALYPGNYLDIRAYLVSQFNPALPQDVADAQNDVIPSSLRFDEIHLNNDGSVLVAKKVKEFLDAKGW